MLHIKRCTLAYTCLWPPSQVCLQRCMAGSTIDNMQASIEQQPIVYAIKYASRICCTWEPHYCTSCSCIILVSQLLSWLYGVSGRAFLLMEFQYRSHCMTYLDPACLGHISKWSHPQRSSCLGSKACDLKQAGLQDYSPCTTPHRWCLRVTLT